MRQPTQIEETGFFIGLLKKTNPDKIANRLFKLFDCIGIKCSDIAMITVNTHEGFAKIKLFSTAVEDYAVKAFRDTRALMDLYDLRRITDKPERLTVERIGTKKDTESVFASTRNKKSTTLKSTQTKGVSTEASTEKQILKQSNSKQSRPCYKKNKSCEEDKGTTETGIGTRETSKENRAAAMSCRRQPKHVESTLITVSDGSTSPDTSPQTASFEELKEDCFYEDKEHVNPIKAYADLKSSRVNFTNSDKQRMQTRALSSSSSECSDATCSQGSCADDSKDKDDDDCCEEPGCSSAWFSTIKLKSGSLIDMERGMSVHPEDLGSDIEASVVEISGEACSEGDLAPPQPTPREARRGQRDNISARSASSRRVDPETGSVTSSGGRSTTSGMSKESRQSSRGNRRNSWDSIGYGPGTKFGPSRPAHASRSTRGRANSSHAGSSHGARARSANVQETGTATEPEGPCFTNNYIGFYPEGKKISLPDNYFLGSCNCIVPPRGKLQRLVGAHVCAFLNSGGGTVYFGLDQNTARVVGVHMDHSMEDRVRNVIDGLFPDINPLVYPSDYALHFVSVMSDRGDIMCDTKVVMVEVFTQEDEENNEDGCPVYTYKGQELFWQDGSIVDKHGATIRLR